MRIQTFLFLLFFPICLSAQYIEVGGSIGASNYLGDLAPSSISTSIGQTNWSKGCFVRYNVNPHYAIRIGFTQGVISGADKFATDNDFRKNRNLSFRSRIWETAILNEINILDFHPKKKTYFLSPFIFGGIAFFQFNPQAEFNGEWYDLQPLGTEGQGLPNYDEKYALSQFSIPVGVGVKIAMNENFTIAFESGTRKTYTDYLDDVSESYPNLESLAIANGDLAAQLSWRQDELDENALAPVEGSLRGDPSDSDWYIFSQITISYNFFNGKRKGKIGKRKRKKRWLKCPDF